jgi:hypothetical protein
MAKEKDTPNLPGSSRMQMPSTSVSSSGIKLKPDSNGVTSKVTKAASGKGMVGKNPYC